MIKPYDKAVMEQQIAHIEQHQAAWDDTLQMDRSVRAYFDEYWAQYEGEGIASGSGPGELYKRVCGDIGIMPLEELI